MTISEEILIVANQLANVGKKPTVALVKTKLSQSVPLPLLINTLKTWQHQPEYTQLGATNEIKTKEAVTPNDAITQQIADAIAPLYDEINDLKKQINALKMKQ